MEELETGLAIHNNYYCNKLHHAMNNDCDELYFFWDSREGKSTGSDHLLACKWYYNLVCVLRRSNLGWPPAPHWATIWCVALWRSESSSSSDELYFVRDRSKGKLTGSDHLLAYKRHYNLVCLLRRSNLGLSPALWKYFIHSLDFHSESYKFVTSCRREARGKWNCKICTQSFDRLQNFLHFH